MSTEYPTEEEIYSNKSFLLDYAIAILEKDSLTVDDFSFLTFFPLKSPVLKGVSYIYTQDTNYWLVLVFNNTRTAHKITEEEFETFRDMNQHDD